MENQQSRTKWEKKIPEKISAKPINEAKKICLILPRYTEKFKEDIKKVLAEAKTKLCKQKDMKNVLEDIIFQNCILQQ